jgi:6-phosphogluconolactonase
MIYRYKDGQLTPNTPPSLNLTPGDGPRHFAFHPNGKAAYVLNELSSTLTVCQYDPAKGTLQKLQTISTLPRSPFRRPDETTDGPADTVNKLKQLNTTAEVVVHPSGKFVYASNRGHDSIAVFNCEPMTGQLSAAGHQNKNIKTPRNFAIEPTGKYCLVANQDSDSVLVFAIDARTGMLKPTDAKVSIPRPVCVRFLAWPREK